MSKQGVNINRTYPLYRNEYKFCRVSIVPALVRNITRFPGII